METGLSRVSTSLSRSVFLSALMTLVTMLWAMPVVFAQTDTPAADGQEVAAEAEQTVELQRRQTIRKLQTIKAVLEDRREQVRNLLEQLESADEIDKNNIREQITSPPTFIDVDSKAAFFFTPQREGELEYVRNYFPEGKVDRVYDCEELLMIVYVTPEE